MKPVSRYRYSARRSRRGSAWPLPVLMLAFACAPGVTDAACGPLPQPDGPVLALTTDSERRVLYVAGEFTGIGGQPRNGLAAIDLDTCAVAGWDPNPNGAVRAFWLLGDDTTLYVGGDFTSIGGQFRERLAALSTTTGLPAPWAPRANASVHALVPSPFNSSFYVGGSFTLVNGVAERHGFVELTRLNGFITSERFDFGDGASIYAIARAGSRLYLAGDFESVTDDFSEPPDEGGDEDGSHPRHRLAALEVGDLYSLSDWAPQTDAGAIRALRVAPDGETVYAGGDFTSVGGAARNGIVALDPESGETLAWHPQMNAASRAILPSFDRSMLYLGGRFSTVGGVDRDALAAVRAVDASLVDEAFDAPGTVCALHRTEDNDEGEYHLYAGGGHCDGVDDGGPAGFLVWYAAIAPEQQSPLTRATPPGGLFNGDTVGPIELECDDFGGSGCVVTYFTTDGGEPDEESAVYSAPINLLTVLGTTALTLKFFSVDEVGNVEPVRTEEYEVERTPPLTTATPGSRVFEERELRVTLSCTDAGSGCAATYYTTDGSLPTVASTPYTGDPIVLTGTTVLQFFSVDVAGNREGAQRQEYVMTRGEVGALSAWEVALAFGLAAFGLRRRGRCA